MAAQALDLPVNVPWTLIGTSQDMMDTQFCDKQFPIEWRSSLAISVFEPKAEDLPADLCEGITTFLKITCTITGYQPTRAETERGHAAFPGVAELGSILDKYFACYGVLLNVAVFPFPGTRTRLDGVSVEFSQESPGDQVPNPLVINQASFQAVHAQLNRIVDLTLPDTSQPRVLDLHSEMEVTVPATPRVEAKVIHRTDVVTMRAYKGAQLVGSQTTGPAHDGVDELGIDADGIDRVVFQAPHDEAFLTEFTRYTATEVPIDVKDFPHVIDFEPKTRDLYQGATEDGEVLTASTSEVKTDKSYSRTDSTESGLSIAGLIGAVGGAAIGAAAGGAPGATAGAQMGSTMAASQTHKWGETNQDTMQVQTDASRDRRERYSTSTNISQMYNLLTGYHLGTNRAVFLMLPRPHMLQPTDFRTFTQGLRIIEGMQEFFLVVTRPKDEDIKGLCVEASLETGHFPEDTPIDIPDEKFKTGVEDFVVTAESAHDSARSIEEFPSSKYTVQGGTVIDRSATGGDGGHNGIRFLGGMDGNDRIYRNTVYDHIMIFNYQPADDATVQVTGRVLHSGGDDGGVRHVRLNFRVFTHAQQPLPNGEPQADISNLIITCRNLCVCFQSGECPEVVSVTSTSPQECIVDEPLIQINPALLTLTASTTSRLPAMKETLRKVQSAMTNSGRLPSRRPLGEVGFLESNYFTNRIKAVLPSSVLGLQLAAVRDLPQAVVDAFGAKATVADALEPNLASFATRTGLSVVEAGRARFALLTARQARPGSVE